MNDQFLTQEAAEAPNASVFHGSIDDINLRENYMLVSWIPQNMTESGIFLPPTDSLPYSVGKVEAIGPGTFDKKGNFIPTELKVGDKVWLEKWEWHQRVSINDVLHAIVRETSAVAVVEK